MAGMLIAQPRKAQAYVAHKTKGEDWLWIVLSDTKLPTSVTLNKFITNLQNYLKIAVNADANVGLEVLQQVIDRLKQEFKSKKIEACPNIKKTISEYIADSVGRFF